MMNPLAAIKLIRWRRRLLLLTGAVFLAGAGPRVFGADPVWRDEFNQPVGSSPDPAKWSFDFGAGGWGNGELETYTSSPANASIVNDPAATDGRALAITARSNGSGYTSARIKTYGLFSITHGLIEARMRIPTARGMWPAFWLLSDDIGHPRWPACGEIDIMENPGKDPAVVYGTIHGPGYSGKQGIVSTYALPGHASFSAGYHVFAVRWAPEKIEWSVDGRVYQTATPASLPAGRSWVFDRSRFFIILNLAVGGLWPGGLDRSTPFPQTLYVDYVRVYDLAAATK